MFPSVCVCARAHVCVCVRVRACVCVCARACNDECVVIRNSVDILVRARAVMNVLVLGTVLISSLLVLLEAITCAVYVFPTDTVSCIFRLAEKVWTCVWVSLRNRYS